MRRIHTPSDLEIYYLNNTGPLIHKWHHYFDIYERHMARFRGTSPVVVEIGVYQGGSLRMWRDYFGAGTRVYGIDINPLCAQFADDNIDILIGSQEDRHFLRSLKEKIPPIDILIDDGGHSMRQQIRTFQELYDHVKPHGVYICEDVHSSYRIDAGGGYKRRGTFIEYTKNLIDYLNAFKSKDRRLKANDFTRTTDSIHYYTSMVVFEKAPREMPTQGGIGMPALFPEKPARNKSFLRNAIYWVRRRMNKVLNFLRLPAI